MEELHIDQIRTIETYYYQPTGEIDYIDKTTIYPIIDLSFLLFKFFIGFLILYIATRIYKNK